MTAQQLLLLTASEPRPFGLHPEGSPLPSSFSPLLTPHLYLSVFVSASLSLSSSHSAPHLLSLISFAPFSREEAVENSEFSNWAPGGHSSLCMAWCWGHSYFWGCASSVTTHTFHLLLYLTHTHISERLDL